MTDITPKTDVELKQIAMDIVNGIVMTDRHLPPDDPGLAQMVFMPLVFITGTDREAFFNDLGMIYEYLDEAGPRGINGYPSFFSMRRLSTGETDRLVVFIKEYEIVVGKFKGEEASQSAETE